MRYLFLILFLTYLFFAQGCMRMRTSDSKAKELFAKQSIAIKTKSLTINNNKLHFVEAGIDTAPTILFIHGSPGSWDAYKGFLLDTSLNKKYRLIAIDRPGFGYSDFGSAKNLGVQSVLICSLITSLNNGKPSYIVGHSYGGPLAMHIAANLNPQPNGVLVLAGSVSPFLEKAEPWRIPFIYSSFSTLVPISLRTSNLELWWLKQDLFLLEPMLSKITCHVSVVHGNKDRLVPYENMQYLQAQLKSVSHIDTLTLSNADHFIPWTHYPQVKDALLKLLQLP